MQGCIDEIKEECRDLDLDELNEALDELRKYMKEFIVDIDCEYDHKSRVREI